MRSGFNLLVLVMAVFSGPWSLFPVPSVAQTPTYNLGRTPTQEEIKAWDISIDPEGKQLPPGSGTAQQGAQIFAQKCAVCHGPTGAEAKFLFGRLVGGKGTLTTLDPVRTTGSFWPFATTIWDYINRAMPEYPLAKEPDGPGTGAVYGKQAGSLNADEVYALTAFLLYQNGIIKETDVLDAQTLPKIRMPNRNGFLPEDPVEWKPGMRVQPHIRKR